MSLLLGFESVCLLLGAILPLMKYSPVQRDGVTLYNLMVKENLWDKADPDSGSVPALNQEIYVLTESIGSKVIVFIHFLIFMLHFSSVALKNSSISCCGPTKRIWQKNS